MISKSKFCGGCEKWVLRADFNKHKRNKDGLEAKCKNCRRDRQQAALLRAYRPRSDNHGEWLKREISSP